MPDIDKLPKQAQPTTEQLLLFHNAYSEVALSFRKLEAAQAKLTTIYNELLIELDVAPGDGIDMHGDGTVKKKTAMVSPLEVN